MYLTCVVLSDDFCQTFEPALQQHCLTSDTKQRHRTRALALREIMTILILFHQSHDRTFNAFYTEYVCASAQRVSLTRRFYALH